MQVLYGAGFLSQVLTHTNRWSSHYVSLYRKPPKSPELLESGVSRRVLSNMQATFPRDTTEHKEKAGSMCAGSTTRPIQTLRTLYPPYTTLKNSSKTINNNLQIERAKKSMNPSFPTCRCRRSLFDSICLETTSKVFWGLRFKVCHTTCWQKCHTI